MVTSPLSDEALEAIEAGCEGVTPWPWVKSLKFEGDTTGGFLIGAADRGIGTIRHFHDAAHITRLDPATILSMVHEIRAARTARAAVPPVTEETAGLREAVRKAVQLCGIASDWNLYEVEIDGVMVGIYDLQSELAAAVPGSRIAVSGGDNG